MSIEHVRALVREAGPALAVDAGWESSPDGPWALRMPSGTTVLVEYMAAVDRLWLCADLFHDPCAKVEQGNGIVGVDVA